MNLKLKSIREFVVARRAVEVTHALQDVEPAALEVVQHVDEHLMTVEGRQPYERERERATLLKANFPGALQLPPQNLTRGRGTHPVLGELVALPAAHVHHPPLGVHRVARQPQEAARGLVG